MKREAFEHLCKLARLELSDEEYGEFEGKFEKLLGFVEKVQAYEPKSTGAPMVLAEKLDLRKDMPVTFEWPDSTKHEYSVPQVIDFEGEGE